MRFNAEFRRILKKRLQVAWNAPVRKYEEQAAGKKKIAKKKKP